MTEPAKRIRLSRQRGWRKPEGAVVVARPSKWGNPVRVTRVRVDGRWMWLVHDRGRNGPAYDDRDTACRFAARFFGWDLLNDRYGDAYPSLDRVVAELAGRDLACWCPIRLHPDGRVRWGDCHADVLLEIASRGALHLDDRQEWAP